MIVFGGNTLFFIFCQIKKDNSYIDAYWGISFLLPLLGLLIKRYAQADKPDPDARCWIVVACVAIWALRLCLHILKRHKEEDFRYKKFRADWMERGGGYNGYLWRAFVYVFMLQGLFSLICNSAALYVLIYSFTNKLIWLDYIGMCTWVFGFLFEVVGDNQLKNHIADKTPGKKKFIFSGLWRYTRHPNYFGEAVLWWGVYFLACAVKWGFVTIWAPLFITYLVRFLSGVPLLEEKYKGNPEWEEYCAQVNVFFPWFTKKLDNKSGATQSSLIGKGEHDP